MPRRDISPGITISAAIVSTVCGVFQTGNLPGYEIFGVSREITVRHQAGDTGVEAYDLDIQYRQKLLLGNYTPLIQFIYLYRISSYLNLCLVTPMESLPRDLYYQQKSSNCARHRYAHSVHFQGWN